MLKIAHFTCPPSGNAGDTVITAATKQIFERFHGPIRWVDMDFRQKTSLLDVLTCRRSDAVLLGAGGLLLSDTNPNKVSGWQWKIPRWKLRLLKTPLIMYGLGYNRFRGQDRFPLYFWTHWRECLKVAKFASLRETGTMKSPRILFRYDDGIVYQPCPSIFYETKQKVERKKGKIAINIAHDRREFRYGEISFGAFVINVVSAVVTFNKMGYEIVWVSHMANDTGYLNLGSWNADEIVNFYKQFDFVIGMRSHSQLIPFGQGTKIISLISHDKLKWFLEDIDCPELGIEVTDPNLGDKIVNLVEHYPSEEKLVTAREKLWDITKENHERIGALL